MTWHATGKCTELDKMQHPVDGRAWKDFDTKYLDFAAEPRNVRLGLVADGFNLFGNLSQSYNIWPVILTTYNLPLWLCVETIDAATGLKFNMRAMVLRTIINDFPARSSLSGWSGQGYKACPTCNEDTPYVRMLGKTAYVGHRRFLKKPHKWKRSLEFNGETKNKDPPREFSRDAIMTQLARLPTHVKGKHPRFGGVKIKHVDAPPDIFDVVDEDDDIIDGEDPIPHDLADSDDEDLVNLDIKDGVNMSADVARSNGGDGGSDDRKGTRKPNLGGKRAGRLHTRQETQNLRELQLRYPSWRQMPPELKAGVVAKIGPSCHCRAFADATGWPHGFVASDQIHLGTQQWHIPGVGRVFPGQGTVIPTPPPCTQSSDVAKLKKREKLLTKKVNMFMKLFRSDDKLSQMLTQLESQPEYGGGIGSGGCEDDEPGDDEDGGVDGEDEDDS
uniref:Uncharacterized protein n=1 Tax=Tanacetum cinerariifolium TaxID=118510 RepID=A0A6L2LJX8_TANCI|nr:hypothetical protein [Tanacetum cinerariifolium]